jgi:glycosyltransferase involved in cell wall biosynthesis
MTLKQKFTRVREIISTEGVRGVYSRAVKVPLLSALARGDEGDVSRPLPVKPSDALLADWGNPPEGFSERFSVKTGPLTIGWIMSPPSPGSGGHQNLFRFIKSAEDAGHTCIIYFYANAPIIVNETHMRRMLTQSGAYPEVTAEMKMYDSESIVDAGVDALFATSWETAYPAFLDKSRARRFYFVQDFEPSFYPDGSESMFAENTYRFGFHAITAGGWLSHKLANDYGMRTDHFDFAVDHELYSLSHLGPRNEIFFYARPSTPRRGFEMGILALEEFARQRPDIVINLAGEAIDSGSVPFAFNALSLMNLSDLGRLYNRCAAGLVISASNMSLLPLELVACGAVPVVNDAPNNRMVTDNPFIEYVAGTPRSLAQRLVEVCDRPHSETRVTTMVNSLSDVTWADSGRQFMNALEGAMRG